MNENKGFPLEGIPELPEGYWWSVDVWENRDGASVNIQRSGGLIAKTCAHHTVILVFGTIRDRHIRRAARNAYRKFKRNLRDTTKYVGTASGIEVKP